MARVWGMNIPPELARDVGHQLETRTGDQSTIISRRRSGSGLATGRRPLIRAAFRDAVSCWLFQTDDQKKQWYEESQGSGMRYYNYFMHKTIPEFYRGNVPSWCTTIENGMLELAAGYYMHEYLFDAGHWKAGDRVRLEFQATWSHFGRYEDEWFPGFYDYDEMRLALQITDGWEFPLNVQFGVRGYDDCDTFYEDVFYDEWFNEWWFRYWGYFPNHTPATFVYEFVVPETFIQNPFNSGYMVFDILNDVGYYRAGIYPVAWLLGVKMIHNDQLVHELVFDDVPDEAPPPDVGWPRVIPFTHDPYSRWGYELPHCGMNEG